MKSIDQFEAELNTAHGGFERISASELSGAYQTKDGWFYLVFKSGKAVRRYPAEMDTLHNEIDPATLVARVPSGPGSFPLGSGDAH